MVWAVKDPTSGNLDRIQIVKGWTKSGQSFEKIFDVVWAGDRKPDKWTGVVPPIGSTVDVENATYTNTIGAVELKTVWTDPEFDPSLHAFYYARVLEIPTPRWTTIQAKQLGIAPPDVVAATLQERAWSSPIWYTPSAEARKNAKAGTTVADLKKQGAVALDDAQLKALIVEKSDLAAEQRDRRQVHDHLRRPRQGRRREAAHARPSRATSRSASRRPGPVPGSLRRAGRWRCRASSATRSAAAISETSRTYIIQNGKIVTELVGTPIEITVYKVGDKYVGARSNEFGYANYEIIPTQTEVSPLSATSGSRPR